MTSITMDTYVAALVHDHGRQVERQAGMTQALGGGLAHVSAALASWIGGFVFRHQARWMQDQAVWFRGAAADIDARERVEPLDPAWVVNDQLRAVEVRLTRLQDMFSKLGGARPGDMAIQMLGAIAALREAVAELRGAIQAYEADRSAIALRGGTVPAAACAQEFDDAVRRLLA